MANLEQFYKSCKIEVETFDFNYGTGNYECLAITTGVPEEIEPNSLQFIVSEEELKAVVATKGYVTVTTGYTGEDTEDVPFWRWSADMRDYNRAELMDTLTDIINKREGRTKDWTAKQDVAYVDAFGDIFNGIGSIIKQSAA